MAVTSNQTIRVNGKGTRAAGALLAGAQLYQGTMCFVPSTGYLVGATGGGVYLFGGIVCEEANDAGGLVNGAVRCERYVAGLFRLYSPGGFALLSWEGQIAYAIDNFAITNIAGGNTKIGRFVRYISANEMEVEIDTMQV